MNNLSYHPSVKYYDTKIKQESFHPAMLAKITDKTDKMIGLQRVYLDASGNKANLISPKKIIGKVTGGSVKFNTLPTSEKIIHLTEGIETALAIYKTINETTYACVSATNLKAQSFPEDTKEVHIWADKDLSETGIKEARKAARIYQDQGLIVFIHLPMRDIEEGKKSIDWLDIHNIKKELITESRNEAKPYSLEWEEPLPIKKSKSLAPSLSEDYLPEEIRDFVVDAAKRISVPNEFIAAPLITMVSILIGRKVGVKPKRHDNSWEIIPNLWCLIISRPSKKKTPSIMMVKKYFKKLTDKIRNDHEQRLKELTPKLQMNEMSLAKVKKEFKDLDPEVTHEDAKEIEDKITKLLAEKSDIENQMQGPRLEVNSATVEKLHSLFQYNKTGLLIFRDEIAGFFSDFNKKGHESDREFYLECWNGNGSFTHDTISRGSIHSEGLCASIMGTIQPDKFRPFIKQANEGQGGADGLVQRFQLAFYPDERGYQKSLDIPVKEEFGEEIFQLFKSLYEFKEFESFLNLANYDNDIQTSFIKYSPKAQDRFDEWLECHDKRLHQEDFISEAFEDHLGKYSKLTVSLSLCFHMIKCSYTKSYTKEIGLESLELAIKWTSLLEKHALKIYSTSGIQETELAYTLSMKIKDGKIKDKATIRAISRKGWKGTKDKELLLDALKVLEKHHFLKLQEVKSESKLGRPSYIVLINPTLRGAHDE